MTKKEIKILVDELRADVSYPDVTIEALSGCGLPTFPKNKIVRKEVCLMHLRWQCKNLDGTIDEEALNESLYYFREKRVIMV